MDLKSIDEVQQYVDAENAMAAKSFGAPQDLCALWRKARPVVMFVVNFMPSSWRAVVQPLVSALDTFCPAMPAAGSVTRACSPPSP